MEYFKVKRFIVLLVFSCVTGVSFAFPSKKTDRSLINILGFLNGVNTLGVGPIQAYQCLEEDDDSLANRCARELCGPPENIPTLEINNFNFDQFVSTEHMAHFSKVEPLITEMMEHSFGQAEAFLTSLKNWMAQEGNQLRPNFATFREYNYNRYASKFFDRHITFSSDTDKPLGERLSYHINFPPEASATFKEGIEAYAQEKKEIIQASPFLSIDNDVYTLEEAREALNERWRTFFSEYTAKKRKDDPALLESRQDEINDIKESMEAGMEETWEISNIYSRIIYLQYLTDPYNSSPSEDSDFCLNDRCREAIRAELKKINYGALVDQLQKAVTTEKEEKINDEILSCKSYFINENLQYSCNEDFQQEIDQVKEAFLDKVFSGSSTQSKTAFKDYLGDSNRLTFSLEHIPPELDMGYIEYLQGTHRHFKEYTSNSTNNYEGYDDVNNYIIELLNYQNSHREITIESRYYNCGAGGGRNMIFDAFLFREWIKDNRDTIQVSPFSCAYPEIGKGIVAHEMGHALSVFIQRNREMMSKKSLNRYMKLRRCSHRFNPEESREPPYFEDEDWPEVIQGFEGDKYTTEEDMADLIGFLAVNEVGENGLMACSFLNQEGHSYTNISLNNNNSDDTHSPDFSRLLYEAIHKKVFLPEVCQKLVDRESDGRFEPCF